MTRRRLLSALIALLALLCGIPSVVSTVAPRSRGGKVRLLAKLKPALAREIEAALPIADMVLVPGQSGSADIESFLGRYSVTKLEPIYPGIVRIKKEKGLTDLQIASKVRQTFAKRAARLHAAFQPPEISRTYLLELDDSLRSQLPKILEALKGDSNVEFAEEDVVVSAFLIPNDPYFASSGTWGQSYDDLWGIKKIGAPAAWDTNTGAGMIVAVVDTGIDYNHADIASNVWINTGEIPGNGIDDDHNGFVDDVRGWDFIGSSYLSPQQSNDPIDHHGHGTHVAGTIAAVGNNGIGVIGVAWHAQVMAVKGLDDQGFGLDSTLAPAIQYAANNGADVINASWGAPGSSQTIADAISYAYNLGTVIIAAAGNDGADARGFYPAALPDVITVGATDPNDLIAGFSNFGSKIDVAAPGVDILSLQAGGTNLGAQVSPGYTRLSGTSMAAPHVSGLAALLLSQNASYSNEDVRQVLRVSATDLGTPGYDLTFGYGRINASAALGVTGVLEAKILAPADGIVTQEVLSIAGVARGTGFASYKLEYGQGTLPTAWTTINTGTTPTSGTLGVFDTTVLADGVYDVRLTALNTSGQAFVDRIQVIVHAVFILSPVQPPSPTSSTTFKNGVVIPIMGTAVGATFQSFAVEWAPGLDPSSGFQSTGMTLAGGGGAPVSSGLLANWDTSSVSAAGYYTIRLTKNSTTLAPQQALTMVYLEPDLLSANWPQFVYRGPDIGAGVVPALNSDGTLRLLMEGPRGLGAGVGEFWTFSVNGPAQHTAHAGPGSFQQPSVANFSGQRGEEAMVMDFGDLELFHQDGTLNVLAANATLSYWGSQTVVEDVGGDSHWDTLGYGIDFNNQVAYLSAWRPDGTQLNNNFPIKFSYLSPTDGRLNRNTLLVGDINGDGKKEIVAMQDLSGSTFTLGLFANDGTPLTWQVPVLTGAPVVMAAADLDNNGKLETIVAGNSDTQTFLHVFQPSGTERPGWPLTLPNSNAFSQSYLAVGDLNRDGHKEIVYAHESFLYVFKDDGTSFSNAWPVNTPSGQSFGYNAVVIGDVDGDGFPEIVTTLNTFESTADPFFTVSSYGDEKLLAIRRDGTLFKSWQLTASNGCLTQFNPAPAIGDFNQDGISDIAVAYTVSGCSPSSVSGIVTIVSTGAKFNPALNDWPLVRHDARNTSVLQNPSMATSSTLTTVASSTNPSVFGQAVTFTATVAATASGASTPSGQVSFLDGGTNLGACTLGAGTCTFLTSALAVGTHAIRAQYGGDTHSTVSFSPSLSQVVNSADFTISGSTAQPVNAGSPATYTITVTPNPSPYNFAVTNFSCAGLPTGATCSFSPNSVTPGSASATTSLTIKTTSRTLAMARPAGGGMQALFAACWGASLFGVLGFLATGNQKQRMKFGISLGALLFGVALAAGCAGGGTPSPQPNPNGTPAGTYNITVTATGNAGASHSTTIVLNVT